MRGFKEFCEQKRKKTIISDVDGVLLDFVKGFISWMKTTHPKIKVTDKVWNLGLDEKNAWDLIIEYWNSDDFGDGLEFFPDAKQGINELAETFELHIASALAPEFKEQRIRNLWGVNYKTIFVGHDKLDHILEMNPDIALEDKVEYVLKMTEAGIDVYYPVIPMTSKIPPGIATPYNNWKQLVEIIKKKYS
jgi:5'(3')-deoxyribonucleotidase